MREPDSSSRPRSTDPARPVGRARKSAVRVNELPDTYPTAQGVEPPPSIILDPVAIPVAGPTPVEADPSSLVFDAIAARPRYTSPKRPRPASPLTNRILWKIVYLVVGVAVFSIGMEYGYYRATRRYEAALSKVEPPTVAAANAKSDAPAADRKKIAEVKPPATPPKKTEPVKPDPPRTADPPKPGTSVAFDSHVLPILQAKCVVCHGGRAKKGELDVRTVAALKMGGENGAAVVPGDLNASILWEFVASNKMPPGKSSKLTPDEKKLIHDWIAGGAK
jgi:hypothetical protein